MKKTACAVLVVVFMMSMIMTAFARPVAKCPDCNGEYYTTRVVTDWHVVSHGKWYPHFEKDHIDGQYTEERTVVIVCSQGSHKCTERRTRTQCDVNPYFW